MNACTVRIKTQPALFLMCPQRWNEHRWEVTKFWWQNIKGKTLLVFSFTGGAGHPSASHHKVADAGCQISDVTRKLLISTSPHLPSLSNDFQWARWKMSPETSSHTIMMEVSLSVAHCAFSFLRIWWKAKKRKFCNLKKRNQMDSLTWKCHDCARAVLVRPKYKKDWIFDGMSRLLFSSGFCNPVGKAKGWFFRWYLFWSLILNQTSGLRQY